MMAAYGFDVKTMTESQCVAELFKLYQELTRRTRMGSQPRPLVSDNIPGRKKALSCEIIPQKAGFLSFYLYLCQVIDDLERNQFTNWKLYERRF